MASSADKEEGFSNDDETRGEEATVRGKTISPFHVQCGGTLTSWLLRSSSD